MSIFKLELSLFPQKNKDSFLTVLGVLPLNMGTSRKERMGK